MEFMLSNNVESIISNPDYTERRLGTFEFNSMFWKVELMIVAFALRTFMSWPLSF